MSGVVHAIYLAQKGGAALEAVDQGELETGRGLVGDRYYLGTGAFSEKMAGSPEAELTMIESEEIEHFNRENDLSLGLGELRRNIITSGIRLNDLVGVTFLVGNATLEGIRLCDPCAYLSKTVTPEVLPGLVHRAGLRARILIGGTVRPGDVIKV